MVRYGPATAEVKAAGRHTWVVGRPFAGLTLMIVLVVGVLLAREGLAADFTVFDGQTVGPQTLVDPGDVGTIEPGGTIQSLAVSGVAMFSEDQAVSNRGTIATTGDGDFGIIAGGRNAVVDNQGTIRTSGIASHAIFFFFVENGTIHNSGSIETAGFGAIGAMSTGRNAMIHNSGSITATGQNSAGLGSFGANGLIINNGSIVMTGLAASGITSSGANGQVVNSGRIASSLGEAISFGGSQDNRLTLLPGSVLEGGVEFGGGTDTLIVGNGLAMATMFDKVPEVFDANGAPFVVQGTTVAVVDPTGFAAIDNLVADLKAAYSPRSRRDCVAPLTMAARMWTVRGVAACA